MSAAQDALREAAAAEQARYARPFREGPREPAVDCSDTLPEIARRRRELLAEADRLLILVRESA